MTDYKKAMDVLYGSKQYEFDDTKLTVTGIYKSGTMTLDFENMTEEMFDEMALTDTSYDEAMRILRASKTFKFDETELTVTDYYYGDEVVLDLSRMTEDMYEELVYDEELENDFSTAVDSLAFNDDTLYR